MKVIAIGDPHFKTDNIREVEMFMNKIEELCQKEQPNLIIILGDLLHTHERLHVTPLNKAYEFVDRMRKLTLTYVIVGNHDAISNQIFLTSDHWMNGMKEWKNVVIVDKVTELKMDKCKFIFVPYVYPGRFKEALNTFEEEWEDATTIFAHQEFQGCKMGAIVSQEGDHWDTDLPYVVSGHIHSRQQPQKNIYYPGSSMQHAFGESEKNVIACLEYPSGEECPYILKEIDLRLPRKKIIYTTIEEISEYEPKKTEDKIKISVSGTYEEFKSLKKTKKYRDLVKSGTKIVFKPKRIEQELKKEPVRPIDNVGFDEILQTLVNTEKNPYLYQAYELLLNNRLIEANSVLYISRDE